MAIHQGIRILDIISKVIISPDLKTTHYAQEEPCIITLLPQMFVSIPQSIFLKVRPNFIFMMKFPRPLTQSFSLKSFTNFGITPMQYAPLEINHQV